MAETDTEVNLLRTKFTDKKFAHPKMVPSSMSQHLKNETLIPAVFCMANQSDLFITAVHEAAKQVLAIPRKVLTVQCLIGLGDTMMKLMFCSTQQSS